MIIRLILIILLFSSCNERKIINHRPNILFIMLDDLGMGLADLFAIDKLISTGLSFKNAYSMPQCTPTRVTLLTDNTHGGMVIILMYHDGDMVLDFPLNPRFLEMLGTQLVQLENGK